MNNIKDYREDELKKYVIANIIIILLLTKVLTFDGLADNNSYMKLLITVLNSSIFSSVIYIFTIIGDCFISSELKKYIVFWWKRMPGETIFSDIKNGKGDRRFTTEECLKKYDSIYENMPSDKKKRYKYENSKWCDLLYKYEEETKVLVSHRDFLMCRDMSSTTILMLIVYFVISAILKIMKFEWKAIAYLAVIYYICKMAAKVKSKRFAMTVISCDIHKK